VYRSPLASVAPVQSPVKVQQSLGVYCPLVVYGGGSAIQFGVMVSHTQMCGTPTHYTYVVTTIYGSRTLFSFPLVRHGIQGRPMVASVACQKQIHF
jgi:hypothetical protein